LDSPPATFPELSSSVQTGVGRLPVWLVRIMGFGSGYYKIRTGSDFFVTGTEVKSRSSSGTKPGPAGSGTGIEKI